MIATLLLLTSPMWTICPPAQQSPVNRIVVSGKCYNVATNESVPCSVRYDAGKSGQTNSSGKFKLDLDVTAKMVYFEAEGFEANNFPVNIIGDIPENTAFEIDIPLIQSGLTPAARENHIALAPNTLLAVNLQFPDSLKMLYIMHDTSKQRVSSNFTFGRQNNKPMQTLAAIPGPYTFRATMIQGDQTSLKSILLNENVTIKAGLNFMAAQYAAADPENKSNPGMQSETAPNAHWEPLTLSFSQSSYQLNPVVKVTLDSIARLLRAHQSQTANITGHTDNVGKRSLNVILSEYRARVVGNYLMQKGITQQQLSLNWKGPDNPLAPNDSEENKAKNRRVEVRFMKK